jgi:hypothetical protein
MTKYLPGTPNENYDFGQSFDYSLWIPGTQVDLVNVPWNNDYRDVTKFNTRQELDSYINSLGPAGIRVEQLSYVKPNEPIRLNIPHNRLNKYNYLRASNPLQPIDGDVTKNFYYFILDTKYIAPNTTEVVLQLDVWQTYVYDITLGNCFVERGHIGIANTKAFDNYGRDYLTVPEGIDLGSDYMVVTAATHWIMSLNPGGALNARYPGFDVLVMSTVDLLADPGDSGNPKLNTASGTTFQATSQGADVFIFDSDQFHNFMGVMADKPWVTQGIISVTVIPRFNRYYPNFDYSEAAAMGAKASSLYPVTLNHDMLYNWRDSAEFTSYIGERYKHLRKLLTYPYCVIEMTTWTATPVILKPEAWHNNDALIFERASLVPPGQRIEISPRFYNSRKSSYGELVDLYPPPAIGYNGIKGDDLGEYSDLVTMIANFPTSSIVNNGQISYLASNVHGIAYQRQAADWAQQRALYGAQVGYDQASGAMATAQDITGIGISADTAQTGNVNRTQVAQSVVSGIAGIAGGAVGGAAGGPASAAGGAAAGVISGGANLINAGIQTAANDEALAIRNLAAGGTTREQVEQMQLMRDTNLGLARYAARGDYANALAGITAKVQDAAMIQPTTSGQLGGESINMVNGGWNVSLRFKMIDHARLRLIGDYWLRYGYAIHAFIRMPQNMMVMSKFTYWKLTETYITASTVPEGFKQAIRGIFEKGVTVWASPNDIGQIDLADNVPLPGISY